jgi:S1 RNA binding domain protein
MGFEIGSIVEGVVIKITKYGAFVDLGDGKKGLIHISEIDDAYVKDVSDYLKEQDRVRVKILRENHKGGYDLSIKKAKEEGKKGSTQRDVESKRNQDFEEMLSKFLQESEERLTDLRKNMESKRK